MLDFRVHVVTWKGSTQSSFFNRQGSHPPADPFTSALDLGTTSVKKLLNLWCISCLGFFGLFGFCLCFVCLWVCFIVVCFGVFFAWFLFWIFVLFFCLVVIFYLSVLLPFFKLWMEKDWLWRSLILFDCLFQGVEFLFSSVTMQLVKKTQLLVTAAQLKSDLSFCHHPYILGHWKTIAKKLDSLD